MDLPPELREDLSGISKGGWRRAEVLHQDLLLGVDEKVALFDLVVEEDHSFCVNGIFAHNTNCQCDWITNPNVEDEVTTGWNASWVPSPRAEHCQDCLTNAGLWAPLFVPAGMTVREALVWRMNERENMNAAREAP